jgi:glycosyltransferase involved in cell wall biosynthesis
LTTTHTIRALGVFLCFNDGDLLQESLRYLLEQNHQLVVWDHGSTDQTPAVIDRFRNELVETRRIPREFDFYELYPAMSRHLIENYVRHYDWISWPDQDEFLEGPTRAKSYYESLREVFESPYDWIQFNNFNYWSTSADDQRCDKTVAKVRHYSLFPDCAPRIRAWRSTATNIREFNHNPPLGHPWPGSFNLRHYPMRSPEQMRKRVLSDRAGLRREGYNYHYENMARRLQALEISPRQLHCDDGHSELNPEPIFNWRTIYGYGPPAEAENTAPPADKP